MDQELRGLVRRPTSSPRQALAQKHLKDHIEKYDQSHEIHRSAEKFIARGSRRMRARRFHIASGEGLDQHPRLWYFGLSEARDERA